MTKDEIIRMAVKCELLTTANRDGVYAQALERFAALVAAHEREACAKVCDEYADKCVEAENWEAEDISLHCAAAIRARNVDSVYTSPERVEKTAESIHDESTNLCQKSTELVEKGCGGGSRRHRYVGHFGD